VFAMSVSRAELISFGDIFNDKRRNDNKLVLVGSLTACDTIYNYEIHIISSVERHFINFRVDFDSFKL